MKSTWTSVIDQTSDAGFRAWVAELLAELDAQTYLTRTGDSGQINTASVVRAATNGWAGYAIWYLNDALHATRPIYIKIEFGSGAAGATHPQMRITVGGGSNGSGTITSVYINQAQISTYPQGPAPVSTVTGYVSNLCTRPGYVMLAHKRSGYVNVWPLMIAFFVLHRSTDSNGDITDEGIVLYAKYPSNTSTSLGPWQICYSFTAGRLVNIGSENYTLFVGGVTASLVSGTPQVYKCVYSLPEHRPTPFVCAHFGVEYPTDTTFTETIVGATPRTYLSMYEWGCVGNLRRGDDKMAVVWEDG